MTFAACWGVLQLATVGWVTRSVRIGTLLLALGVGLYGCGPAAALVEWAYTRVVAAVSGGELSHVVTVAGYTVDPVIEEVVKILPLAVIGLHARTRMQWGMTDYLLLGGASGAGFGLLEALMRFGSSAGGAVAIPGGWLLPSIFPPFIPGAGTTVRSWLPAPASGTMFTALGEPQTSLHIVYSVLAGLGVGVFVRIRGPLRLLGLLPFLLATADHAATNYDLTAVAGNAVGDALAAPFMAARPVLGIWPVLALGVAMCLDLLVLHRGKAAQRDLLLAGETRAGLGSLAALARYALMRVPWTTLVTLQYVRLRRAALFASADSEARGDEPAYSLARDTRVKMDLAGTATAWSGAGLRVGARAGEGGRGWSWIRRSWPLLVWLILLAPSLIYYLIGTVPALARVQDVLGFRWVFPVLVVTMVVGLVWIGWQIALAVRHLPSTLRQGHGDLVARIEFRIATGAGAAGIGALSVYSWLTGTRPDQRMVTNLHVLDALSDLLLIAGVVLLLAAFVFFPPLGVVALAGGGSMLVLTVTTGFVTLAGAGVASIMLSQAAGSAAGSSEGGSSGGGGGGGSGGGGGGGGGPGVPPRLTARDIADNPQLARGQPRADVERALDDLLDQPGWVRMPVKKGEGTRWVHPNTGRAFVVERQTHINDPLHQGWYLRISDRGTVTRIPLEGNPVLG
jgi:hypothetical protein